MSRRMRGAPAVVVLPSLTARSHLGTGGASPSPTQRAGISRLRVINQQSSIDWSVRHGFAASHVGRGLAPAALCCNDSPEMAKPPEKPAKTLPKRKPIRLALPDYHTLGAWYFVTICCRDKKPHMKKPSVRDTVISILEQTASSSRVEIAAYSILPNHLHMICSSGTDGLVAFIGAFKSKVTREIRRTVSPDFKWQKSFFDHKIRNEESLSEKVNYIWQNPVRLGLSGEPDDYRWSGRLMSG